MTSLEGIITQIKIKGNPKSLDGMARFGIRTNKAFGVSLPEIRKIARQTGRDHELALRLWDTGFHEARLLAPMIDDPAQVTEEQMDKWVVSFDSWDVVDGCCGNLFDKTEFAVSKAREWAARQEEYVKRAGFALMAEMAVHNKKSANSVFEKFLPLIEREAVDERNYVKKAVNWALRQIGKRNIILNDLAIKSGKRIQKLDSRAARWIAADALRELTSTAVQKRLIESGITKSRKRR